MQHAAYTLHSPIAKARSLRIVHQRQFKPYCTKLRNRNKNIPLNDRVDGAGALSNAER